MAYKQVLAFDPQRMGNRKGWCEMNVRLGFGIPNGTFPSAKADMESQIANGTFHVELPPSNIAVPVFFDTSSQYEHVMGFDHGNYYSDRKLIYPMNFNIWKPFGWGELCDGVRVVEYTPDPVPPTPQGFLPEKGYWCLGDRDARIGQLASFMRAVFPAYTQPCALGNYYGKCIQSAVKVFQSRVNLVPDGCVGRLTYAKLKQYGFKG